MVCWSEGWEWEIRPIFGWNSQCFGGTESRNASKENMKKQLFRLADQSPELSVMNLILPLDRTARDIMLVAEMV